MRKVTSTAVRATSHSLKLANKGKREALALFMSEYRNAVKHYTHWLWTNRLVWGNGDSKRTWNLSENRLDVPSMISTVGIEFETKLTARALKCAATQACGIVGAVVDKRVKDQEDLTWKQRNNRNPGKGLLQRLSKPLTEPDCKNINAELNSICAAVGNETNSFDLWLELSSLFKPEVFGRGFRLALPSRHHKRSRHWLSAGGRQLPSFLVNESSVQIRYEIDKPVEVESGEVVGLDQGKKTCITVSNGLVTGACNHGHDLDSIVDKLSRRKKGSKSFEKAVEHRRNHVNWAIKSLKLDQYGVKEIMLEGIVNINYGRNVSRGLKHWTNTSIRDGLEKWAWENGVRFSEVKNSYNSQRCSNCGWTRKSNRKGKAFVCGSCGNAEDADFNASKNVALRNLIPDPPFWFREHGVGRSGFFWNPSSPFTNALGRELTVPDTAEMLSDADVCLC